MEGRIRMFLVRHGEVDTGPSPSFYGFTDVSLSAKGREQMDKIALRLETENISEAYSSDLKRAAEGARVIAKPHSLEVKTFQEFREINLGVLEGLAFDEAQRLHPESAVKSYRDILDFRIPQGENIKDVWERVVPTFKEILEAGDMILHPVRRKNASGNPSAPSSSEDLPLTEGGGSRERRILIVAHNTVNRVILAYSLGLPYEGVFALHQSYGCLNIIDFRPEGAVIRLLNG